MDCIKNFDIHLEKDIYCSGELINGTAIIENGNDIKVTGFLISSFKQFIFFYLLIYLY